MLQYNPRKVLIDVLKLVPQENNCLDDEDEGRVGRKGR
jgi:hypothetical protein